ncbi:hypothetical protein [Conchiformibius steedae]|uniref:Uncharacterized protein n=1 Tax=Conchiformibius steedae TaxID=153493 RepID=A0A3P2A7Q0_9NEIS|nr:hypothetical protein [Conchiformibius steedae]RRD91459.1 hypothetical protein EII21_00020 [Conchiformibius steedae]
MAKNQTTKNIIGLQIDIVDETTGAPASYHVISDLTISMGGAYATATLASYYNRKLHDAGKHAMGTATVTLYGTPPRGEDALDWAYRSIAAPIAPDATDIYGNPLLPHSFTGAVLVSDSPAETGSEAG